ncbi:hypothetical protein [Bradyrhizobium diazoefficiens]|uniref:hypothetical protein n=1 Tax=Bradyrhizobium diazoefficiens TaxID=1355477 RepID=UPI0004B2AFE0|nr:hypothetical protein [Bradyrhizobium diazoefficiens]
MTDDGQADVQPDSVKTLPLTEFSPRAGALHESAFGAPIMTDAVALDRMHAAVSALEALKLTEGETLAIAMPIGAERDAYQFTQMQRVALDAGAGTLMRCKVTDRQALQAYVDAGLSANGADKKLGCSNKRIMGALDRCSLFEFMRQVEVEYHARKFALLAELSTLEIVR